MKLHPHHVALMASEDLPEVADGDAAPEWVHLLPAPADGRVLTADSRGPYTMAAHAEIIAASFEGRDALEIDINHSTFLAAPKGERSDAVGWITEMQSRPTGLWGRVKWNAEGAKLVAGRIYRKLSPVVIHDPAKRIFRIANASLVNRPNLRGLTALNFESTEGTDMNFQQKLAGLLGLAADATEDQISAAITTKQADTGQAALQSALTEIGAVFGVAGETAAIVTAATALKATKAPEIVALQAELASVTTQLNALTTSAKSDKATDFVDGEIKRGRVGVKPLRDHYIAMHMEDAERVEKEIAALPILGMSGTTILPPAAQDGQIALNAEQLNIANMLGIDPAKYLETLKADARKKEAH